MATKELNLNRKRLADVTDKILKISRKKRSLKEQGKHKHTGDRFHGEVR